LAPLTEAAFDAAGGVEVVGEAPVGFDTEAVVGLYVVAVFEVSSVVRGAVEAVEVLADDDGCGGGFFAGDGGGGGG